MKLPWYKFSRPKGPGFEISGTFYVTVLAARAALPPPRLIANPKGEHGAVTGFAVPLASDEKEDLDRPLQRGMYAIATSDRRTVLRMRVISKEEAGFDPGPFLRSELGRMASEEVRGRVSATWTLLQLTFETYHPDVYPAVRFLAKVCQRLGELTDGVVADPICQRYELPTEIKTGTDESLDVESLVAVRVVGGSVFTLGLQKFVLPEYEVNDVPESHSEVASRFLLNLAHHALHGKRAELGDRLGKNGLEVVEGGLNRARWEGIPCLELVPVRGTNVAEALVAAQT